MNITRYALKKERGRELWSQYKEACKNNPKDKHLVEMKQIYYQLKAGRKVIDIFEAFKRGGINEKYEPKLAICQAHAKEVFCEYHESGRVTFSINKDKRKNSIYDVEIPYRVEAFPKIPREHFVHLWQSDKLLNAPVPLIPVSIKPSKALDKYYVLWEVDEWKPIPPKDPWLLRRLTKNMFVILAGWNLTKLEQAVMRGRV